MNSGLNKYHAINLWDKWLKAPGVDNGCGYRVPVEVWNAAWNGHWPDDEGTIRWIVEEYLDLETAKAAGYLELVLPLRDAAEAALNAAKRHRQVKIDADIDEVIKIIRELGCEPGEKPSRQRNRWMRSATTTVIAVAVAAIAGFVGGYNLGAVNRAGDMRLTRSPEIRRAIPVEPEVRRAISVAPEIRKAIPVHRVLQTHARVIRAR
jgi:hypothetical protein